MFPGALARPILLKDEENIEESSMRKNSDHVPIIPHHHIYRLRTHTLAKDLLKFEFFAGIREQIFWLRVDSIKNGTSKAMKNVRA